MIAATMTIRVRYAETDKMQVAHHSKYLEWYECARTEMMREIGYPYKALEQDGVMLPLIETNCRYIQPAVYDDLLEITAILAGLPRSTIKIDYLLKRSSDQALLAEAYTIHAFVNKGGQAVRPPKKFMNILRTNFEKGRIENA
ncbi:MAG: thioesterase family protein [bacterium]